MSKDYVLIISNILHQYRPIKVNEMRKEVAIISVVRNGRITIPEELRKELGIIDGTKIKVELDVENGRKSVILTKM